MHANPKKKGGFTIMEMVLYVAIFAVIGTLGAAIFDFALRTRNTVGRSTEVQVGTQRILSQIAERASRADTIVSGGSSLTLKMGAGDSTTTIYALTAGSVTLQEGAALPVSITPTSIYVTALSFSLLANANPAGTATSSVQISITTGYNEGGAAATTTLYTLQTTAVPL